MRNHVRQFYEFGPFRLDPEKHRLLHLGEPVPLPPKAMEALVLLVQNPGKMLEREQLMQAVWKDSFVEDANLTVAISHLRKALNQIGETAEYIETIPRVGYRFVADVRDVSEELAPLIIEKRKYSQTTIEEELINDEPHSAKVSGIVSPKQLPVAAPANAIRTQKILAWVGLAVLLTTAIAAMFYFRRGDGQSGGISSVAPIRSIAVLPPKAFNSEVEDASLSLGMADALITRLSSLRKLVVRPTSAVSRYVSGEQDSQLVGRALGVDAVLDGSLQRANGKIKVTLRLIQVDSGTQVWTGSYVESEADIFKLQDSISQQVAETLAPGLTQDEKTLLKKRSTENPEAYALYLKGNYYWSKRGDEAGHSAAYFRQAIELDPNFAQAYVGLASVDAVSSAPSTEAEILIEKALKLDNKSAEAHATYGFIRMFHHWDWAGAGRAFDYALELNPNSSLTHHWKGVYLSLLGRLGEAKAEMHRALELDPLSLIITADIGQLHYFAHEYDEAIVYCNRAVALDSNFEMAHMYLADIYYLKGMEYESGEEWVKVQSMKVRPEQLEEAKANLRRLGWRTVLRQAIQSLIDIEKAHPGVLAYQIAWAYLRLGDKEAALHWLEQAVEQRLFLTPFANVDPVFDPLRGHPRFRNVVQRMGL